MINVISYHAEKPGIHLLILGAIHGNEKCGAEAQRRVLKEFESGSLELMSGTVTFVPICNPRAYAANVRFIERNLNRFLVPQESPNCYEARLGNILCPLLAKCDVLLDLHSYDAGEVPFVFVGPFSSKDYAYAACLQSKAMVTGWEDAYAASGKNQAARNSDESTGTTEYSRRHGAVSVTLECGLHNDPASYEFAYQAIHRTLRYWGLVEQAPLSQPSLPSKLINVQKVFYREPDGVFVQPRKHLDPVVRGETIATYANGEKVLVPDDGYIVLPNPDAQIGHEWFYWGVERPLDASEQITPQTACA